MWGGTDDQESIRTIHAALDKGINLIDTAPVYGFGRSKVESIIPAYPAEQELQKVSGLGLRVLADPKVLSALQSPGLHNRPIVLEGWLGVRAGVLRVRSVRAA